MALNMIDSLPRPEKLPNLHYWNLPEDSYTANDSTYLLRASDRYFVGIRPDFTFEVREDLRLEKDGPTLVHAIQGLHDSRIILPRRVDHRPAVELLEQRYDRFRQAQSGVE